MEDGKPTYRTGKQIGEKQTLVAKYRAGKPTTLILRAATADIPPAVENGSILPSELLIECEDEWGHVSAPTVSDGDWCIVWNPRGCLSAVPSSTPTSSSQRSRGYKVSVLANGRAEIPPLQVLASEEDVGVIGCTFTETFYLDVSGGKEEIKELVKRKAPKCELSLRVVPSNMPASVAVICFIFDCVM